jgi:surface antigen
MRVSINAARVVAVGLAAVWAVSAFADPPAHAPAHGWRKKQAAHYVGRGGTEWERDFDISSGRCNRDAIGAVVGGVVGGVIANRVGDEHPAAATIVGVIAGALIGHKIGSELDERDRGCFGHALEIGKAGRAVVWTNESNGVRYEMSPGADRTRNGAACREFTLVTVAGKEKSSQRGLACQSQPGAWQVVQ